MSSFSFYRHYTNYSRQVGGDLKTESKSLKKTRQSKATKQAKATKSKAKKVGTGHIDFREKVQKIPKSIYIPAGLKLDNSVIPGAGLGIFATRDFPDKYDFGPYKGKWLTPREYNELNRDAMYVWEVNDYRGNKERPRGQKLDKYKAIGYWDGEYKKDTNFMRYINHPRNKREWNMIAKQIGKEIHYIGRRPIKAGEELFINYGPSYSKLLIGSSELPE